MAPNKATPDRNTTQQQDANVRERSKRVAVADAQQMARTRFRVGWFGQLARARFAPCLATSRCWHRRHASGASLGSTPITPSGST
jgi:hypothetical protein